ncbi:hypothetical protein FRC02_010114 [Tulasnella sp. 418]|nr:hypothetical protein FRC02_010114 [Tulasnella sp. 418]
MEVYTYPHFPSNLSPVYIGLLHNVKNASTLRSRIVRAATMQGPEGEAEREAINFAFIDARLITSLLHLLTAIQTAAVAASHSALKTRTVHSEILWALNYSNNITESIRRFGVSDESASLIIVRVGVNPESPEGAPAISAAEMTQIAERCVDGQWGSLNNIQEGTDWSLVKKYYKLNSDVALTQFRRQEGKAQGDGGPSTEERRVIDEIVTSAVAMKSVLA